VPTTASPAFAKIRPSVLLPTSVGRAADAAVGALPERAAPLTVAAHAIASQSRRFRSPD
jgi:hypothetical protein